MRLLQKHHYDLERMAHEETDIQVLNSIDSESTNPPKELIQIAEYFRTPLATAVTGGDRISNSESPIPGGGDDYTQSRGK